MRDGKNSEYSYVIKLLFYTSITSDIVGINGLCSKNVMELRRISSLII